MGFICTEAYLSCQGGLSRCDGVYMYRSLRVLLGRSVKSCQGLYVQKVTCPVRVVCHVLMGFICTEAYLFCQGGLSGPVGVYMYQKLTCSVILVCHILLGFICTRSLRVLSGWSVTSCWGLYVPGAYLFCQAGPSRSVGVHLY